MFESRRGHWAHPPGAAGGPFRARAVTAGDLGEIADALSKITVQGARYPEHLQKRVGR